MASELHMKANTALIGAGLWGRNIARNLAGLGALKGIYDQSDEQAAHIAASCTDAYHVQPLTLDGLLADPDITGVAIAAPAPSHHDLAIRALAAGKHIYVEKPLALSLVEAEAIANAAKQAGKHVMLGHLLRYHGAFIALDEAITEGWIGQLTHIRANRLAPGRVRATESALYDLCPHDLAMMCRLMRGVEPVQVSCQTICHITAGIDDIVHADFGFANGVTASIQANWMNPVKVHNLTVIGDEASLVFDDTKPWESKLMRYPMRIIRDSIAPDLERGEPESIPLPASEPLKDEMRAFLAMIDTNTPPPSDITEALYVQRMLDRMERAAINTNQQLSRFDSK